MTVFCGGTETNFFAESINHLLRDAGLTTSSSMFHILRCLQTLLSDRDYRQQEPFKRDESVEFLDEIVLLKRAMVSYGSLVKISSKQNHYVKQPRSRMIM